METSGRTAVQVKGPSVFSGTMNLVNTCVGVGILTIPTCVATSGLALSGLLIVLNAFLMYISIRLLVFAAIANGGTARSVALSLDDLGHACFGRAGVVFVRVVNLGMILIALLAFTSAMKGFLQDILGYFDHTRSLGFPDFVLNGQVPLFVVFFVLVYPWLWLRRVSMLQYAGAAVLVSVGFMVVVVLIYLADPATEAYVSRTGCSRPLHTPLPEEYDTATSLTPSPGGNYSTVRGLVPQRHFIWAQIHGMDFLSTLGLISTSFICQLSLFPIFREMLAVRDGVPTANVRRVARKVTLAGAFAASIAAVLYLVVGFAGYFTWGELLADPLNSSLLYCYDMSQPMWGVVFLAVDALMIIVSAGAFPTVFFAFRDGLTRLFTTSSDREGVCSFPPLDSTCDAAPAPLSLDSDCSAELEESEGALCEGKEARKGRGSGPSCSLCSERSLFIVFNITIPPVVVLLSSFPQLNLKLVLSWGAMMFGYPLAFTLPGLFYIRSCWFRAKKHDRRGSLGSPSPETELTTRTGSEIEGPIETTRSTDPFYRSASQERERAQGKPLARSTSFLLHGLETARRLRSRSSHHRLTFNHDDQGKGGKEGDCELYGFSRGGAGFVGEEGKNVANEVKSSNEKGRCESVASAAADGTRVHLYLTRALSLSLIVFGLSCQGMAIYYQIESSI